MTIYTGLPTSDDKSNTSRRSDVTDGGSNGVEGRVSSSGGPVSSDSAFGASLLRRRIVRVGPNDECEKNFFNSSTGKSRLFNAIEFLARTSPSLSDRCATDDEGSVTIDDARVIRAFEAAC
ncbi:hypothetical protein GCK72_017669 [Caenorhabditis remanei]|uniref:Uncharacterized protein n=1 Tax=Caenorhabditis remanei TaxID=31234 RepID=A0A6A5G8W1_CAERE|nr:hypothetical protein GCK72_017669 [Caenorhabditis remanei]KAF1751115.1 hypothetical protein GCK72_017669 [Caenorhabditis remanei]